MNMQAIETASRQAWPALLEKELSFGVLRYSKGVSRRANSCNPAFGNRLDPGQVIRQSERFFAAYDLPSIVRVVHSRAQPGHSSHSRLDACLEAQGYAVMTPTRVMQCELPALPTAGTTPSPGRVRVAALGAWLQTWYALLDKPVAELAVHRTMLSLLSAAHQFLVLIEPGGRAVSCGMAVRTRDLVGVFGIATAPGYRGQGYATRMVRQLLDWGVAHGATRAYLQVEASNAAALAVYEKIGFETLYDYWYREKQLVKNTKSGE